MKILLCFLLSTLSLLSQELLTAPSPHFRFVDQKNGIGNSCGPASLLNAFGSGSEKWRQAYLKIPGSTDRTRISSLIKTYGLSPSTTYPQRARWDRKGGINFTDLQAMANDMRKVHWSLSSPRSELFFSSPAESPKQLQIAHKRLARSLKKGLPPILSIRRFVFRKGQWQSVHGHFVVLQSMPKKLPRGSQSFAVTYLDPIGAKSYSANVQIAQGTSNLPCLILNCPTSPVGKTLVKKGEPNTLGLAGAIGAW